MSNLLVYTILLALQIVGFDAADTYEIDVLEQSSPIQSLQVHRTGPVLFLRGGDDTVLEVEQSQLYAHMYSVYTAADEPPRAFNLLEPLLQLPASSVDGAEISIPRQFIPADTGDDTEVGVDSRSGRIMPADVPSLTGDRATGEGTTEADSSGLGRDSDSVDGLTESTSTYDWTIQRRGTTYYVTATSDDITVVLRLN